MPSNKLLSHPEALCNMVRRIAVEAGHVTLDYFDIAGLEDIEEKADGSPVTAADLAAEGIIEKGLFDITPDIPIIGEEAAAEGRLPKLDNAEYFWLVDPLDGTREFITGSGDYTVNIALIHKGSPIVGVVYAPVLGTLYAGFSPGKALRWTEDTGLEKEISVRPVPKDGMTVVASKNHGDSDKLNAFLEGFKVKKIIRRGSSLKICAVAEGKADLYPRFGPTCEWDTAAGDAVLRAAGGVIAHPEGETFTYGHQDQKFLNSEFIAAGSWYFDSSV